MALVSCPTGSIGTLSKHDLSPALEGLPDRIYDNVFHAGFHSESSFGATSYVILREGGTSSWTRPGSPGLWFAG
jgi:hypothetical protein